MTQEDSTEPGASDVNVVIATNIGHASGESVTAAAIQHVEIVQNRGRTVVRRHPTRAQEDTNERRDHTRRTE